MAERFPLFLAAALSCLFAACWPPGRGWSWPLGWGWGRPRRIGRRRVEAIARVGWIAVACGLIAGAGRPPGPDGQGRPIPASESVARGQTAYAQGRIEEALAAFEEAIRSAPAAAVPRYDAAAALFRLGRYGEARERYTEARERADDALRTKIDYALGNTAMALGDVAGAIAAYDSCIASTARGNGLSAVRQDAAINREFAIEQAPAPSVPQGQEGDDPSSSQRPDGRRPANRAPARGAVARR